MPVLSQIVLYLAFLWFWAAKNIQREVARINFALLATWGGGGGGGGADWIFCDFFVNIQGCISLFLPYAPWVLYKLL